MVSALERKPARVEWVDLAKGWCIILVVMMHSALGVGLAVDDTGWLHGVVAFAKPFRMPDFFIVAGLFVGGALQLPWRAFLDRKVVHFAYFYAVWLAIVLLVKASDLDILEPLPFFKAYLWGFVDPFSTMWFIQILPLFFVALRLMRGPVLWPAIGTAAVLHIAAATVPEGGDYSLSSAWTGWPTVDNFAFFFVYFLIGAAARHRIFAFAKEAARHPAITVAGLALWAVAELWGVRTELVAVPGLTLVFGIAGAGAVIATSALLARLRVFGWLAYCGRHSIVIYLSFVLPMAAARMVLIGTSLVEDVGTLSLIVAAVAIVSPLVAERVLRHTPLAFLFRRPAWARLPTDAAEPAAPRLGPAPT